MVSSFRNERSDAYVSQVAYSKLFWLRSWMLSWAWCFWPVQFTSPACVWLPREVRLAKRKALGGLGKRDLRCTSIFYAQYRPSQVLQYPVSLGHQYSRFLGDWAANRNI